MSADTLRDQVVKHLTTAHAIEEQALAHIRAACKNAGDGPLEGIFREHLAQTEEHERLVRRRLEALGASPSKAKDVGMRIAGAALGRLPEGHADTPARTAAYSYAAEQLEVATYELLRLVAERAGDDETATAAKRIGDDDRATADRLLESFDEVVEGSLPDEGDTKTEGRVTALLADAHALESQSLTLLERAQSLAADPELAALYRDHLEESTEHVRLLEHRLRRRGGSADALAEGALRLQAMNLAAFFEAQPDTEEKLATTTFAAEHLEIAVYEQLLRVAAKVGDEQTVEVAERILQEERAAADRIAAGFGRALDAALQAQDVGGR
jgi:ferritin-like metal-binding protein YciE